MGLSRVVKANVKTLRGLFGMGYNKNKCRRTFLVNPEICERAMAKLDLKKEYKHTSIIELNPGLGLWSAALQEHLKPKRHILLEPDEVFRPIMQDLIKKYPGMDYVPLDGYNWDTYTHMFSDAPHSPPFPLGFRFKPKTVPVEEGVNTDLLVTGNLTTIIDHQLIAQFMNCCALRRWVQQFGRVRFLLWTLDNVKDRYLPKLVAGRLRPAVIAETLCDVMEIAGSPFQRTGKGYYKVFNAHEEVDEGAVHGDEGIGALHGTAPMQHAHSNAASLMEEEEEPYQWIQEQTHAAEAQWQSPSPVYVPDGTIETPDKILTEKEKKQAEKLEMARLRQEVKLANKREKEEKIRLREEKALAKQKGKPRQQEGAAPARSPEKESKQTTTIEKKAFGEEQEQIIEDVKKALERPLNRCGRPKKGMEKKKVETDPSKIRSPSEPLLIHWQHPAWYEPTGEENIIPVVRGRGRLKTSTMDVDLQEGLKRIERRDEMTEEEKLESRRKYEAYLKAWERPSNTATKQASMDDDIFARKSQLLMRDRLPSEPLILDEEVDVFPHNQVTLLSFTPKVLDPYFCAEEDHVRQLRFESFDYLLRNLFTLRAKSIESALKSMCPGGEYLLEEEGVKGFIDPDTRVRLLKAEQFIALARAWEKWPFKTKGAEWEEYIDKDSFDNAAGTSKIIWGT
ncbi:Mitochondrial transcription factor 1 [Rhizina undulata]